MLDLCNWCVTLKVNVHDPFVWFRCQAFEFTVIHIYFRLYGKIEHVLILHSIRTKINENSQECVSIPSNERWCYTYVYLSAIE